MGKGIYSTPKKLYGRGIECRVSGSKAGREAGRKT